MKESEFWQRPTSRRGFLSAVGAAGATAALSVAAGGIDDTNPRIESAHDIHAITPIYGNHVVGNDGREKTKQFYDRLETTGIFPEGYVWPGSVSTETRNIRPDILAVDSLSHTDLREETNDEAYANLWRLSPGNPFRINPNGTRIIAADLPYRVLTEYEVAPRQYLSRTVPLMTPTALEAIKNHYETTSGKKLNADSNLLVNPQDISKFYDYEMYEAGISNFLLGMGPLAYLASESAIRNKPISRRKAIALGAVSALGFGNTARIHWDYITNDPDGLYKPQYAPLSTIGLMMKSLENDLPYLELRNTLLKVKLEDTQKLLKLDRAKKVAVVGSAHQFGKDIWYSATQADEVLATMFKGIFEGIEKGNGHGFFEENAVEAMVRFFGGVKVFKVGSEPATHSVEEVKQNIEVEATFVSPTIRSAVEIAASDAGFGVAIR